MANVPRAKQAVCNRLIYHHSFMSSYWLRGRYSITNPFINDKVMKTTTPQTDLEIFQSFQIEALQTRNVYLENELKQAKTILQDLINEWEVEQPIVLEKQHKYEMPEYAKWKDSFHAITAGITYSQDTDND